MRTYKNKPNGFKEIRKKEIRLSLPVVGLALIFGIGISYSNSNSGQVNTLPYVLLIALGAAGFGVYKGLNRQRQLFESYVLTIDEDLIQREQLNTPTVKIRKNEIQGIIKNKNGITIRGQSRTDFIVVARQIDNYDEIENLLNGIIEIKTELPKTTLAKIKNSHIAGRTDLNGNSLHFKQPISGGSDGTILTLGLVWSFYEVQTSKNIDSKTKRGSWWTIVVILSVVVITVKKFVG